MKYSLFSIKDKALDTYSAPYMQATADAGIRMFRDLVYFGDENNRYKRSPEDYTLYIVGEFDDETAELANLEKPILLTSATEMIGENSNES